MVLFLSAVILRKNTDSNTIDLIKKLFTIEINLENLFIHLYLYNDVLWIHNIVYYIVKTMESFDILISNNCFTTIKTFIRISSYIHEEEMLNCLYKNSIRTSSLLYWNKYEIRVKSLSKLSLQGNQNQILLIEPNILFVRNSQIDQPTPRL